jgi:hypothetical protein
VKLLSLPTFFAAAKKVGAAPHRGNANRPIRKQGKAKNLRTTTKAGTTPQRGNANRPIRKQGKAKNLRTTTKADAAPQRGRANRPTRIQENPNTQKQTTRTNPPQVKKNETRAAGKNPYPLRGQNPITSAKNSYQPQTDTSHRS